MAQSEADYIDSELQEWTPFVIEVLHKGISQRNLLLTEDLYRSLRWEVLKATAGMVATAKLSFRMHGRWKDMRTIRNGKQLPVQVIIDEFVQKLGVSNFRYVPGYTAGKTIASDSIAMRRIAWGISKSLAKQKQTAAKKWYSKNFYGAVNVLIDKLMTSTQDKAATSIKESMSGNAAT
jgi:hypothetical protein